MGKLAGMTAVALAPSPPLAGRVVARFDLLFAPSPFARWVFGAAVFAKFVSFSTVLKARQKGQD
jgi:hypothetical protein